MGFSVNSNIAALRAQSQVGRTNSSLEKNLGRISSGKRITSAADDAAAQSVATILNTIVRSNRQAMRNANDGTSILQTAESTAQEITELVQRSRELFVQSASETLDDDERAYIEDEYAQIRDEIDRAAEEMIFNGLSLNDSAFIVQIGAQNDPDHQLTITVDAMKADDIGMPDPSELLDSSTAQAALQDVDGIDAALDEILSIRSILGSAINRMAVSFDHNRAYTEALVGARSRIEDADYALETAQMTKLQIMQQAGVASLAQAKNLNQTALSLLQ
jgi:flagellin